MEYQKPKSASKVITTRGPRLSKIVIDTLGTIAKIVGGTLGPGGRPVLLERFEHDLPPLVTKDGVTVFRSLGFTDPTQQCLLEAVRDVAQKTADAAGDGTTTATILAESIARATDRFCSANPRVSPQKVVRRMEKAFYGTIEPTLKAESIRFDSSTEDGKKHMKSIALISANGDEALADAVLECFRVVGDDGNVTIAEISGPSTYKVEPLEGYQIPMGFEESCLQYAPMFVNNPGRQMCVLENAVFVLYNGFLNDTLTAYGLLDKVGVEFEKHSQGESEYDHHCVVFVAAGFSHQVLATFGAGMQLANALRIFPMVVPKSPIPGFQAEFLDDLAAVTGAAIFDPISRTLDGGSLADLGPGVESVEIGRRVSNIIGHAARLHGQWEDALLDRVSVIEARLKNPEGALDKLFLEERLGKLTGGIARLIISGSSNGELKEKSARADDAVCAVRGAIKHGCLPGGGWGLLRVVKELHQVYPDDPIVHDVLQPALLEPVNTLLMNCGMTDNEVQETLEPVLLALKAGDRVVYDALAQKHGDAVEMGILDSAPAVIEAIRNSLSIAALAGTLGGTVVQPRDAALERTEARDTQDWIRNANVNEANERG